MAKKQERNDFYKVGAGNATIKAARRRRPWTARRRQDVSRQETDGEHVSADGQQLVGSAKDVVGKLLIVETVVTDVSIMTNKMSVVIMLTGGPSPKTITRTDEVERRGVHAVRDLRAVQGVRGSCAGPDV